MRFEVRFKQQALEDLKLLQRSEPAAYKKALRLIAELYDHPTSGTGHPELLRGASTGWWSRRITQKHRLVYKIHDAEVMVMVLMAYGHYDDK